MQVRTGIVSLVVAALLTLNAADRIDRTNTLSVRIAKTKSCFGNGNRDIVVQVRSSGRVRISDREEVDRESLARRLAQIFERRDYRYAYMVAEPQVSWGEVLAVIQIAATQVDYVTILTPAVSADLAQRMRSGADVCLDPNLPSDYTGHPSPRH